MYCQVEINLKNSIKAAGLKLLDVANKLNRPYGTLAGWLNGFSPLPVEARRVILEMIENKNKEKKQ